MMSQLIKRFPRVEASARRLISLYPLSARLGPAFWQWYAFLDESEAWPVEQLQGYQFEQLRLLLADLAKTSPFYARRLADVPIPRIQALEDFRKFVPALSRQEFRENFEEILRRDFRPKAHLAASTSGTTGTALEFHHAAEDRIREWASICHQWKRVGFDPVRSRRAEFRGLTSPGKLFQEFPDQNMVRFSILDLRAEALPAMADQITSGGLRFYHGYPSAFYLLARQVLDQGIRFPEPEAFLLASEMVYDFQLETIQAAFPKARLYAHYGCAERTVLAGWCEHRQVYHVLPQYSLVEIDPTSQEMIGTNLYNRANGFVRYRMTDQATGVETGPCPACRRPYPLRLAGLDGRREDYLFSPERGWIAPAVVTYPLKHLRAVQELQFEQREKDQMVLNYVLRPATEPGVAARELEEIEAGLRRIVGKAVGLQFCRVDAIPRGATGKYKWIVNRLSPP